MHPLNCSGTAILPCSLEKARKWQHISQTVSLIKIITEWQMFLDNVLKTCFLGHRGWLSSTWYTYVETPLLSLTVMWSCKIGKLWKQFVAYEFLNCLVLSEWVPETECCCSYGKSEPVQWIPFVCTKSNDPAFNLPFHYCKCQGHSMPIWILVFLCRK